MQRVAREIRVINTQEDLSLLMMNQRTMVDSNKCGVYEHAGEMYRYAGTNSYVDYYEKLPPPLEVGIAWAGGEDK